MAGDKIRLGLIGGGKNSFIGNAHRIAAYMVENYQLVGGVFGSRHEESVEFAHQLSLDAQRAYPDLDAFIAGEQALPASERIEAVAVLTPNYLHYAMAKALIEAGFHVMCEKPVTFTAAEAKELQQLVEKHGCHFAVAHTYTGYPMVRQLRAMIAAGEIGKLQKVDIQYYQGWINPFIHDNKKRRSVWRLNPECSGQSCCFGDIGVHAFNLLEYVTGDKVTEVLATLNTLYADNPLDIDGTALVKTAGDFNGIIRASQIATGEENNIQISVYGDRGGLVWRHDAHTQLTLLRDDQPEQVFRAGNSYNAPLAANASKIAPGHPEGLFDALGNLYAGFALAIRNQSVADGAFPGIAEGVRGMQFIEAAIASHQQGQAWISLP